MRILPISSFFGYGAQFTILGIAWNGSELNSGVCGMLICQSIMTYWGGKGICAMGKEWV